MIHILKKLIGTVAGFFALAVASIVFAQGKETPAGSPSATSIALTNPLGSSATLDSVLNNINSFLVVIAAPICGIMVVWGGFQMMTSAGDPTKFSEGRKTLTYAAVGFVIVIFASSVVPLIKSILNGS